MEVNFTENKKEQLKFLSNGIFGEEGLPVFSDKLLQLGHQSLKAGKPEIFQINLGYMCNQTCKHCHVDAGPTRKEIMDRNTMSLCLEKLSEFGSDIVDLTGGAPEMNPDFRWFVEEIRKRTNGEIIVRSNLTIIMANPKYRDLPQFFRDNKIRVVSSLPFYSESKTDRQRGKGVFAKSIEALKLLNEVGYGKDLTLDLVYNPSGAFLPGDQLSLEKQFKEILLSEYDIHFNNLLALTNLPINRFLDYLVASGNYEEYMEKLVMSFNPQTLEGVMCKNTLSVDYRGYVYDCDFNQMLELPVNGHGENHLRDLSMEKLVDRNIIVGQHCYGCTAGAGSSCQGTTV